MGNKKFEKHLNAAASEMYGQKYRFWFNTDNFIAKVVERSVHHLVRSSVSFYTDDQLDELERLESLAKKIASDDYTEHELSEFFGLFRIWFTRLWD